MFDGSETKKIETAKWIVCTRPSTSGRTTEVEWLSLYSQIWLKQINVIKSSEKYERTIVLHHIKHVVVGSTESERSERNVASSMKLIKSKALMFALRARERPISFSFSRVRFLPVFSSSPALPSFSFFLFCVGYEPPRQATWTENVMQLNYGKRKMFDTQISNVHADPSNRYCK